MRPLSLAPALLVALPLLPVAPPALACGGFFCETTPIDQAAEQIVFRQEADRITAMVRILYSGDAERFSWVVPVPNTPELSLGADQTFPELDLATRPRFLLERRGEDCPVELVEDSDGPLASSPDAAVEDGDVTIEAEEAVGPFDTTILSSDNPDALATWLMENDYDLSDRGRELIAPYVEAGMKFVAVKLRNGQTVDTIQPLVMQYTSEKPMIPIRLTAVAAEDDMGVLVWVIGDARAVPENYLHVTPNYARLNWYAGPQNAYASYQQLITDAMDEVEDDGQTGDGQGFATDFAGRIDTDLVDRLAPSRDRERALADELAALGGLGGDAADYIAAAVGGTFASDRELGLFDPTSRLAVLQDAAVLPLPSGANDSLYFDAQALRTNFTSGQLGLARAALGDAILERELEPLRTALGLVPEGAYMTRLYTTLSADEMTADPTFGYNASMPEQSLTRRATLDASCENGRPAWTLTLGSGTGRDGEVVITAEQPVPFSTPAPAADLPAAFLQSRTSAEAMPDVLVRADATALSIAADGTSSSGGSTTGGDPAPGTDTPPVAATSDDDGFLGLAGPGTLLMLSLLALRRRLRRDVTRAGVDRGASPGR